MKYQINVNNKHQYNLDRVDDELLVNGSHLQVNSIQTGANAWHIISNHKSYRVEVVSYDSAAKNAQIKVNGTIYHITAKNQYDALLEKLGLSDLNNIKISEIKAPMPGLVLKVFVSEGDEVKKGDSLFILEAMKMENIIKSPADVKIKSIKIKPGDKVEKAQILMEF